MDGQPPPHTHSLMMGRRLGPRDPILDSLEPTLLNFFSQFCTILSKKRSAKFKARKTIQSPVYVVNLLQVAFDLPPRVAAIAPRQLERRPVPLAECDGPTEVGQDAILFAPTHCDPGFWDKSNGTWHRSFSAFLTLIVQQKRSCMVNDSNSHWARSIYACV